MARRYDINSPGRLLVVREMASQLKNMWRENRTAILISMVMAAVVVGLVGLGVGLWQYYKKSEDASRLDFDTLMQQPSFRVRMSNEALQGHHQASTLLIDCVDYRLRDETERFMRDDLHLVDQYDEIAIPGAALALENTSYPHWARTTTDIIALLQKAHHIQRVIFLDHRECAAYAMVYGQAQLDTPAKEHAVHAKVLAQARQAVQQAFPALAVYTLLIGLDGVVENLTPAQVTTGDVKPQH